MRFLFVAGLAISATAIAAPAFAADDPDVNCKDPVDQTSMNICADRGFKAEDTKLNHIYSAYRQKLTPERRVDLTTAQKVWLTFRDTECHFEAADYQGGSMQPMVYAGCLSDLTRQRREGLEALLKDADN